MEPVKRDLEKLKKEMEMLKAAVSHLTDGHSATGAKTPPSAPVREPHPDPTLNRIMETLNRTIEQENRTGSITYLGVFASGGRQSNWIRSAVSTDDLIALAEDGTAEAILRCIGNQDRLTLLLALMRKPMNVAAMVESCGFRTTGQVYHHLRPLLAADLVYEEEHGERGVYADRPYRVQGIIMLLAGVADLMDATYSRGSFTLPGEAPPME